MVKGYEEGGKEREGCWKEKEKKGKIYIYERGGTRERKKRGRGEMERSTRRGERGVIDERINREYE